MIFAKRLFMQANIHKFLEESTYICLCTCACTCGMCAHTYTHIHLQTMYMYIYLYTDVNECDAADKGGCEHDCVNTDGSYRCECEAGYRLANDGHTCEDKCEDYGCSQNCVIDYDTNSPKCTCNTGYGLNEYDHKTCDGKCLIGHVNVQSCLLINFQYKPISLQYS